MFKKIFGSLFIFIALIILIAVLYQIPMSINTAFIKVDKLDFLIYEYITLPIVVLIIAFFSICFFLKLGVKWIKA